jgi:hypothetical protein
MPTMITPGPMAPPYVAFCPGCDKAYTKGGFKTHCRSKKHKLATYEYDQRMIRIIRDTLVAVGGVIERHEVNTYDPLESLGEHIAYDKYEIAVETAFGKLVIKPSNRGIIFTRFETHNPNNLYASWPSGKWNFHYDGISLEKQHIDDFFTQVRRLLDVKVMDQVRPALEAARKANKS